MRGEYCVYLINIYSDLYKIGYTSNLKKRVETMESNCGNVKVENHWNCGTKSQAIYLERWLQCRMRKGLKYRREFFTLKDRVVTYLKSCNDNQIIKLADHECSRMSNYIIYK
jgi:predicted GIY-YIG superfamily endonuclease